MTDSPHPLGQTALAAADWPAEIQRQAESEETVAVPQVTVETLDNSLSAGDADPASYNQPVDLQGQLSTSEIITALWRTRHSLQLGQTTLVSADQALVPRCKDRRGTIFTRSIGNPEDTFAELVKWYGNPIIELTRR